MKYNIVDDSDIAELKKFFHEVKPNEEYNTEQLYYGTLIEYEHTNNKEIAEMIAKHHLKEFEYYYRYLLDMEIKLMAEKLGVKALHKTNMKDKWDYLKDLENKLENK